MKLMTNEKYCTAEQFVTVKPFSVANKRSCSIHLLYFKLNVLSRLVKNQQYTGSHLQRFRLQRASGKKQADVFASTSLTAVRLQRAPTYN